MISRVRRLVAVSAVVVAVAAAGCHSPGGAWLSSTGESITYVSTSTQQIMVELVDVRDGAVLFRMDVPPGKQLTIDFIDDEGDDPSLRPDLMKYDVWDTGTRIGRLRNAMTVPSANARRMDVFVNQELAYVEPPAMRELRTDELDGPDWWTPEGGPAPTSDRGVRNYDG